MPAAVEPPEVLASTGIWTWAQRRIVAVSCLGVSVVVAAMAALYSALPEIAIATGATQTQSTWMVDSYTLALACLVLPAGTLGDRYGRRLLLIVGLAVFAAACLLPVVTDSVAGVIAGRAAAWIGAALVMPSTLSLLTAAFPEGEAGRAIGLWAGFAGSGGLFGLVGSGLLLQAWSWHSIFVGLAAASAVLFAAAFTLTESRSTRRSGLDPLGTVTVIGAIGLLVWALITVADRGWTDPWIIAGLVGAALATSLFVLIERRVPHPLLDLNLLSRRGFGAGAASISVQFLVTFGLFLIVVQYLQLLLGYSPLRAAIGILPMGAVIVVLSGVTPYLHSRYGLRGPTVAGLVVLAAGLFLLSRITPASGYLGLLAPLFVISFGLGLAAAPATTAIMTDTPPERHGLAAAVNDAAREIGAAIGIAISGTVLAAGYRTAVSPALSHLPEPARAPVAHSLAATTQLAQRVGPSAQPLLDLARSGFLTGMHHTALALAGVSLAAAFPLGIWARNHPGSATDRS